MCMLCNRIHSRHQFRGATNPHGVKRNIFCPFEHLPLCVKQVTGGADLQGVRSPTAERLFRSRKEVTHMKWNTQAAEALYTASKESNPEAIPAGEYWTKITAAVQYTIENPKDEAKPLNYGALIEVTIMRGAQKGKKLYAFLSFDERKRKDAADTAYFLRTLYMSCCVKEPEYTTVESLLGLSGYIVKYRRYPKSFSYSIYNGHKAQLDRIHARIEAEQRERKERNEAKRTQRRGK